MIYSDEIIEEVRQRNDIVDVVSSYVRLTKKGSNYFGLCPFHNEKSASFSVSPIKQMYYCFGCGAGGNVVSFIMQYENQEFPEALQYLADRAGITLPETQSSREDQQKASEKAKLLDIQKKAAIFYVYQMNKTEEGKRAKQYLLDRGLSQETIARFGLGYSPMYKDALYRYLKREGISDELLKKSGLFTYKDTAVMDRFFNRVMFPIMDRNSKVIGFGGRVMGSGEPKYLNSPETVTFDKSRNLFGLHEAKHSREDYMLVCEGYMDVISLHQAGFINSVASLGTALTSQQANLLKRYTKEVVLTYDSDGAGMKAALRAIPIFREVGIRTKVLNMKPYKDPDEFIKNLGKEEYAKRIEEAENSFIFEISCLQMNYDMENPEEKTEFYHETAKKLLMFREELDRSAYMEAVSKRFHIAYDSLKNLVYRLSNSPEILKEIEREKRLEEREQARIDEGEVQSGAKSKANRTSGNTGLEQSARLLLTWIAEEPDMYHIISRYIAPEEFIDPLTIAVARMLYEQAQNGTVNPSQICNHFQGEENQRVGAMFFSKLKDEVKDEKRGIFLNDTIKKLKQHSLEQRAKTSTDFAELQQIIQEQKKLDQLNIELK